MMVHHFCLYIVDLTSSLYRFLLKNFKFKTNIPPIEQSVQTTFSILWINVLAENCRTIVILQTLQYFISYINLTILILKQLEYAGGCLEPRIWMNFDFFTKIVMISRLYYFKVIVGFLTSYFYWKKLRYFLNVARILIASISARCNQWRREVQRIIWVKAKCQIPCRYFWK